jgi:hypothetical protein
VRLAVFLLTCLVAGSAKADATALLAIMGGQGCNFGAQSIAASAQAGFDRAAIDATIAAHLADGTGERHGVYGVRSADVCNMRPPKCHY